MKHVEKSIFSLFADLPPLEHIGQVAKEALNDLPDIFRAQAEEVEIRIENYADKETLKSLNMEDKYDLLGLYRGTPLPVKPVFQGVDKGDCILLYRCPLIRYAHENRDDIQTLIKHVVIHELGYHFGYNRHDLNWYKNPKS